MQQIQSVQYNKSEITKLVRVTVQSVWYGNFVDSSVQIVRLHTYIYINYLQIKIIEIKVSSTHQPPQTMFLGRQWRCRAGSPPRDTLTSERASARGSPVTVVIPLPQRSPATNAAASTPHTPSDSKASGTQLWVIARVLYLRVLAASARAAAEPAWAADDGRWDGARVSILTTTWP